MIQLRRDALYLTDAHGETTPCSVDQITLELVGAAADLVDPEVMRHAATGVLHYFREELGRDTVSTAEFAEALARVLARLGLSVELIPGPTHMQEVRVTDLRELACACSKLGELDFFPRLHSRLRSSIGAGPVTVEFRGLRGAVKLLSGRKHWCKTCRDLEERIVHALRRWWSAEHDARESALYVH